MAGFTVMVTTLEYATEEVLSVTLSSNAHVPVVVSIPVETEAEDRSEVI
jgi:hypothetical protein